MSAFYSLCILVSAQTKWYLGSIFTFDSYDLSSLRVQGIDTFPSLTDKRGNVSVVIFFMGDQRPLGSWADYVLFDTEHI